MGQETNVNISGKGLLISLVLVVLAGVGIYIYGKTRGSLAPLPLPDNGNGIPAGWTATADVIKIRNAINGFGTDEEGIFNTLTGKTRDQLIAIKNEYAHRYGEDMLERFNDELSGDDLQRALQFYNGII